jgi:hypothetical protein
LLSLKLLLERLYDLSGFDPFATSFSPIAAVAVQKITFLEGKAWRAVGF